MPVRIASWNINSVRLRAGLVQRLAAERPLDVICLQETKCRDAEFPRKAFEAQGYRHIAMCGQKGYHGVAVLSRLPIAHMTSRTFCGAGDARHLAVDIETPAGRILRVHNFYVPAGGDEPDAAVNPKFAHKLAFLDEMERWCREAPAEVAGPEGAVLVGDLNVAPLPEDVWSHRQLLKVVSHTPAETERLERVRGQFDWRDVVREAVPPPDRLFTWWSYRARDWRASNRGRRLDHIWSSPGLAGRWGDIEIIAEARGWERPSDHVPVLASVDM